MIDVLRSEWFWAVLGVIFAVALGVGAPIFGALISGNADLKKRRYEMYFENKLEAYSRLLTLLGDATDYEDRKDIYLSPEYFLAVQKARLLSSDETSVLLTALSRALGNLVADKNDDEYGNNFNAYIDCLNKLIASMKLDLVDAKRLKTRLYIRKTKS